MTNGEKWHGSTSWASSPGVRRSMQSNKGKNTKPELRIRSALHALGTRYHVHARPLPNLKYEADLVFTKARIAVFIDGCYWHVCPDHHTSPKTNAEFWARKFEGNQRRDAETDRLLREAGWQVIRIWEHEDVEAAAAQIYNGWAAAVGRPGLQPSGASD